MSGIFDILDSRRRGVPPPTRPLPLSQIGKMIEEHRKIAMVREVIDATHWTGIWRGQAYECRQFPDTNNLSAGDTVVVHAMPGTTELFSTYFPTGGPELWFSPGAETANYRGQVWRAYRTPGGTPFVDYTIEQVWEATNDGEYVTHICWSKPAGRGYVFTWQPLSSPTRNIVRAYRITQHATLPNLTLVDTADDATWPDYVDPVVDTAQFLNHIFGVCGGYRAAPAKVMKFDVGTETMSFVFDFPSGEIGGGIATDSGNGICYAHDGHDLYHSINGVVWDFLLDLHAASGGNSIDFFAMITDYTTPQIYGGLIKAAALSLGHAAFTLSEPGEAFAIEYTMADPGHGFVALANQWNAAGQVTHTWAIGHGQDGSDCGAWVKPIGGAWAEDWVGPAPPVAHYWLGFSTQGIVYFDTQMWAMWANYWEGGPTLLYRRGLDGTWVLMQTFNARQGAPTYNQVTGMAPLPSIGAGATELAAMKRQHEVN